MKESLRLKRIEQKPKVYTSKSCFSKINFAGKYFSDLNGLVLISFFTIILFLPSMKLIFSCLNQIYFNKGHILSLLIIYKYKNLKQKI